MIVLWITIYIEAASTAPSDVPRYSGKVRENGFASVGSEAFPARSGFSTTYKEAI